MREARAARRSTAARAKEAASPSNARPARKASRVYLPRSSALEDSGTRQDMSRECASRVSLSALLRERHYRLSIASWDYLLRFFGRPTLSLFLSHAGVSQAAQRFGFPGLRGTHLWPQCLQRYTLISILWIGMAGRIRDAHAPCQWYLAGIPLFINRAHSALSLSFCLAKYAVESHN